MSLHVEYELLASELPAECIAQCSAPGRDAEPYVAGWRERLDFTVNRANAIKHLRGYGAWDDLETWTDARLAETVLWLACGDFSEPEPNGSDAYYLD